MPAPPSWSRRRSRLGQPFRWPRMASSAAVSRCDVTALGDGDSHVLQDVRPLDAAQFSLDQHEPAVLRRLGLSDFASSPATNSSSDADRHDRPRPAGAGTPPVMTVSSSTPSPGCRCSPTRRCWSRRGTPAPLCRPRCRASRRRPGLASISGHPRPGIWPGFQPGPSSMPTSPAQKARKSLASSLSGGRRWRVDDLLHLLEPGDRLGRRQLADPLVALLGPRCRHRLPR